MPTPAPVLIVPDLLRRRAVESPDAVAVEVDGDGTLTYGEWDRRSNAAARGLAARGVVPGDRVMLVFDNADWIDYAVCYAGVHKAAAAAVPLGTRFSGPEMERVMRHCEPRLVLSSAGLVVGPKAAGPGVAGPGAARGGLATDGIGATAAITAAEVEGGQGDGDFQAPVGPAGLAEILYTSGTTGLPKGVACSHESVVFHDPPPESEEHGVGRASFVHAFPVGTNAGQEVLRLPLRRGDRVAVAMAVFDPERFCALVAERRVRRLQLVPAMARLLVDSGAAGRHDVSSVERVVLSSAPTPASLLSALSAAFPGAALWNTYALTEAGTARTLAVDAADRAGSVGRPVGGTEVRIVGDAGADVAAGHTGEIWLRRPGAPAREYYRDPEATAAMFPAGGWLRTGDLGYLDVEGYLYVVDRKKDLIIVGGLNVSSLEVEGVLSEHPAVADAAVFAVDHEVLGQDVAAAVVARSPVGAADLQAFVRERLGEHKVPHHVSFLAELPRNPSGKVLKHELRQRLAARPGADFVAARHPAEAAVVAIWEAVLGRDGIGVHDDFFDLGGHSLAAARIVARVNDALGSSLPLASIFESPTPAGMAAAATEAHPATGRP